jgi:type IV fimbrial biogenesis protein FimT
MRKHFAGRKYSCLKQTMGAFTLVELLLVIAIIAIVIAIGVPSFTGMGRGYGMNSAVSTVCATLTQSRQWAITHRENVSFVYFASAAPSPSYYYVTNNTGVVLVKTNELPMEVILSEDGSITFKSDGGLASGAGNTQHIYIWDRKFPNDNSKGKTIEINGLTGGIKVE